MNITNVTCSELACEQFVAEKLLQLSRTYVKISTNEGIIGVSLWRGGIGSFISKSLKPILIGEDPLSINKLWEKMYTSIRSLPQREAITAVGAVDAALWDLFGKLTAMPVYKLLGGYRDRVPVYGDGIYSDRHKWLEMAKQYVNGGYTAVKLHQNYGDIDSSIQEIKVLRETLGEEIKLMIDVNCSWSPNMAIKAARQMEQYNVFWLEDPVLFDVYLEGCRRVRASTKIPITAGEYLLTMYDCKRLIENESADIINFDPIIAGGGITPWMRVAAMANLYHVHMAPHGSQWPEITSQITAAISNGLMIPMHPTFHPIARIDRWLELYKKPVEAKDGYIELPKKPGLGIQFNETTIDEYTVASY